MGNFDHGNHGNGSFTAGRIQHPEKLCHCVKMGFSEDKTVLVSKNTTSLINQTFIQERNTDRIINR